MSQLRVVATLFFCPAFERVRHALEVLLDAPHTHRRAEGIHRLHDGLPASRRAPRYARRRGARFALAGPRYTRRRTRLPLGCTQEDESA